MTTPKPTTADQIEAVAVLRAAAQGAYRLQPDVRNAIRTLDNADLFADLDQERNAQEDRTP